MALNPARQLRHSEKVRQTISSAAPARSGIAASWRRSMLHHGLTPDQLRQDTTLTERELRQTEQSIERLLHVADPHLENLYNTVGHSGCCVVLTDLNGIVLRRLSTTGDEDGFDNCGLRSGSIWSEETQGTNGIGTTVIEERPVLVYKDQHFRSTNIGMTCMGAPIFDVKGKIMAVLDVTSAKGDLPREYATVISSFANDVAQRIEAEYFRSVFHRENIVVPQGQSLLGTPLLASDQDRLIVGANRAARRLLNLQDTDLNATLFQGELLDQPAATTPHGLAQAEKSELRRAIARAGGNMSAAAKDLNVSRATFYRMIKKHKLNRPRG